MSINKNYKDKFYKELSRYLREKNYKSFAELVKNQNYNNFFYNPLKIESRFEILSENLKEPIQEVITGYQTSALGDFIEILRFFNDYNLLERHLNEDDHRLLQTVKKDTILIANLMDLFGKISNSFILYIIKEIPKFLYDLFISKPNFYFRDSDSFFNYVKNVFFNQYTIYGLSVGYLGSVDYFFKEVMNELEKVDFYNKKRSSDFIEIDIKYRFSEFYMSYGESEQQIVIKKHLIYPKNVLKYMNKILDDNENKDYKFYSLSMVLLGGIGPQGHGFTYSTPKGEVIEICSDIKENKAIIVKYKLFLKEQFISRLKKELFKIDFQKRNQIIYFLNHLITPKEIIGYKKLDSLLTQIKTFLHNFEEIEDVDINKLFDKIEDAISIILRPISMIDQFKARMDLVEKEQLKSEDIAKLTSLRNKSHYDVLRERLFFQYIVDLIYKIYKKNKEKK
jgi:hypothetical protein